MKKLLLVILAAVAVASFSVPVFAADDQAPAKVIVYYFHGTFRCYTCTNMEKYARETIEANFKDTLASGVLEFRVVNVEARGNEHFIDDYKLYTKSLILSLVRDGKEIKAKNLDKIWEYARIKQRFSDYVNAEISNFLEEAR